VAPPPVGFLAELAQMFAGAEEKSKGFSRQYRRVAEKYGCGLLDAGDVARASDRDGIHLEAEEHRKLGEAVAASAKGSLSC
jgi:lysophospholipase L1-like esterase